MAWILATKLPRYLRIWSQAWWLPVLSKNWNFRYLKNTKDEKYACVKRVHLIEWYQNSF